MIIGPPPKFHGTRDILNHGTEMFMGIWKSQAKALTRNPRAPDIAVVVKLPTRG